MSKSTLRFTSKSTSKSLAAFALLTLPGLCLSTAHGASTPVYWQNPGTGDFYDPANWPVGAVLDNTQSATIANGGTATLNGSTTWPNTIGEIQIGDKNPNIPSSPNSGSFIMSGSAYLNLNEGFYVGNHGIGDALLTDNAQLVSRRVAIGNEAGSHGTVTLSGSATWYSQGTGSDFYIGDRGVGTLNISGDAKVFSDYYIAIGRYSTGNGSITVSGNGELQAADFVVSEEGVGSVLITDNGKITSSYFYTGLTPDSVASVTVNGNGNLHVTEDYLGAIFAPEANSTLTITGGGSVEVDGDFNWSPIMGMALEDMIAGGYDPSLPGSTLNIAPTGTQTALHIHGLANLGGTTNITAPGFVPALIVQGDVFLSGTLNITPTNNGSVAIIATAGTVNLGGTLNLNLDRSEITKASDLGMHTLFHAEGGYSGNFDTITFSGTPISALRTNAEDYLTLDHLYVQGKDMFVDFNLTWFTDPATAHGNFTLGAGETFEVDVPLTDRTTGPFASGWDGKSLNKYGPGTLTFSAPPLTNVITGTYRQTAGTVDLRTTFQAGTVIIENSTLNLIPATTAAIVGLQATAGNVTVQGAVVTGNGVLIANAPTGGSVTTGGNVTIDATSTLSPGIVTGESGKIEIHADSAVTLAAGARYIVNITGQAGTPGSNDLITITVPPAGTVDIALLNLSVVIAPGVQISSTDIFTIIESTGSLITGALGYAVINGHSTTTVRANGDWRFEVANLGGSIVLQNGTRTPLGFPGGGTSIVPEPSTYALFGGLFALGLAYWRRRQRKETTVRVAPTETE